MLPLARAGAVSATSKVPPRPGASTSELSTSSYPHSWPRQEVPKGQHLQEMQVSCLVMKYMAVT